MRFFFFRHDLRHFGVKVSIVEPGYFRIGITDLQVSLAKVKQVWEEVPMHIKETYGEKCFDGCELFFF